MSEPAIDQSAETTPAEPAHPALICEADLVQVDLPEDQDPFGASLQVAGLHPSGTELVVWLRLTPTTIERLVTQLREMLHEQHTALGIPPEPPAGDDVGDSHLNQDPAGPEESRVRRFLDPLGVRHVTTRTPRSTLTLAAAIAALMLLAFIVSEVRG